MGQPAENAGARFDELLDNPETLARLTELNFVEPTPVQRAVIPVAREGKDVLVQAKTGSGKTLAFVLSMLKHLETRDIDDNCTQALIVTPTRELATQVASVVAQIAPYFAPAVIIGGASSAAQEAALDRDPRIVVGTPGRILDMMERRVLDLRKCSFLVLDEADEMLSMGFIDDVRDILRALPRNRQGIMASATVPPRIEQLSSSFLREPTVLRVGVDDEAFPSLVEHLFAEVPGELGIKTNALCDILEVMDPPSAIIFCNTKSDTELVEVFLRRRGYDARKINGDLSQGLRDSLMAQIRSGELQFLVSTDVSARGIDLEGLELVINYGIHERTEAYVHRTGRTGRAGRSGKAISIIGPSDDVAFRAVKRDVAVEFKPLSLPSEEEVVQARVSRIKRIVEEFPKAVSDREQQVAKAFLADYGCTEPNQELVDLGARLVRAATQKMNSGPTALVSDQHQTEPRSEGGRGGGGGGGGGGGRRNSGRRRR